MSTDPVLDKTLPTRPAPPKVERSLGAWALQQIQLYRVTLVASYVLHIAFAAIAFFAGLPIFRLTVPDIHGYTRFWAVVLAIVALAAAVGALRENTRGLERWAALGVLALSAGYVAPLYEVGFVQQDLNRQAVAVGVTFMLLIPFARFMWLASRAGRKPAGGGS